MSFIALFPGRLLGFRYSYRSAAEELGDLRIPWHT